MEAGHTQMFAGVWVGGNPVRTFMFIRYTAVRRTARCVPVSNFHGVLSTPNVAHVAFLPCWRLRYKMKVLESALWMLIALALPRIAAQDSDTATSCAENSNGCSTFSFTPCRQHFRPACDRHDTCYECGAHFNFTKDDCDNAFLEDMTARCDHGTDDEGNCPANQKRREASSMSITTPLRQLRLLEKFMPPNSLSDRDPRQRHRRSWNCTVWAKKYFDAVQWFGWLSFEDEVNATLCSQFEACMPQVRSTA